MGINKDFCEWAFKNLNPEERITKIYNLDGSYEFKTCQAVDIKIGDYEKYRECMKHYYNIRVYGKNGKLICSKNVGLMENEVKKYIGDTYRSYFGEMNYYGLEKQHVAIEEIFNS